MQLPEALQWHACAKYQVLTFEGPIWVMAAGVIRVFGVRCHLASQLRLVSNAILWCNFLKHCKCLPSTKCRPMGALYGRWGTTGRVAYMGCGVALVGFWRQLQAALSHLGSPQLLVLNAILLSFSFCCCNLLQQIWFCLFHALTYYACFTWVRRLCQQGFGDSSQT